MALLQPAPETYDLFDDIILMAEVRSTSLLAHSHHTSIVAFEKAATQQQADQRVVFVGADHLPWAQRRGAEPRPDERGSGNTAAMIVSLDLHALTGRTTLRRFCRTSRTSGSSAPSARAWRTFCRRSPPARIRPSTGVSECSCTLWSIIGRHHSPCGCLQALLSQRHRPSDRAPSCRVKDEPYKYVAVEAMAAAFEKSPAGQRRAQELQTPYEPTPSDENALVRLTMLRQESACRHEAPC